MRALGVVADRAVLVDVNVVDEHVDRLDLELQQRLHLTYLLVAHDLSVVKHISDRVAVMYVGQIVETAPAAAIFSRPRHPYTAALMRAVPAPDPRIPSGDTALDGEVPNPANPPSSAVSPRGRRVPDRDARAPRGRAGPPRALPSGR